MVVDDISCRVSGIYMINAMASCCLLMPKEYAHTYKFVHLVRNSYPQLLGLMRSETFCPTEPKLMTGDTTSW